LAGQAVASPVGATQNSLSSLGANCGALPDSLR
jgi:hypothetical protein